MYKGADLDCITNMTLYTAWKYEIVVLTASGKKITIIQIFFADQIALFFSRKSSEQLEKNLKNNSISS